MKAINYYIVIEKIKEKPKSESGFVLTETQNDDVRYLKGRVESIGDLVNGIKKDDIVYYDKNAGHGIEFDGNYYFVIKHADVVIVE
jgi:co-chaperonin GroES (HSP10)|tara:strand:- start:298 stop:555 length:258 start_codon:yes stop_codon:yes gene_type:complete